MLDVMPLIGSKSRQPVLNMQTETEALVNEFCAVGTRTCIFLFVSFLDDLTAEVKNV